MSDANESVGCSVSIWPMPALLAVGVTFTVLKLCGVIDWSWWLVLLPIYAIPAGMLFIAVGVALCFAAMMPVLVIAAGVLHCLVLWDKQR